MMYEVKKIDGFWVVRCKSSGRVQFKSLSRKNASDWLVENTND